MSSPDADERSDARRLQDERIADEPKMPPFQLPPDAVASPVESHLQRQRPIAVQGVVEHGLIRPLDPTVNLPEHSRVIIVAAEQT
jgi:hypothetical protein